MFGGDRGVGVGGTDGEGGGGGVYGSVGTNGEGGGYQFILASTPLLRGVVIASSSPPLYFSVVPLLATLLLSPPLSPLTLGLLIPTFDLAAVPALPLYLPATLFLVDFMSSTLGAPPVLADRGVLEAEAEVEGRLEGVFMRTGPERRPDDGRVAAIGVRAGDLATAFLPCSPNLVCTLIFLPPNPPS
eukprot:CAMPEP_0118657630 /NCGR_PEP_ID=MMETSP0785-20121206/14124_1 /TAXON_ID=91992 /ORGANISM="Bolidomonas pacifica, Strain CCMP 1866" /LENGTH=186 /DNA_ID=CAMNT_0006550567 /DNA_START=131 /DNA_END=690 /DNA_ORIENTATION=-